MAGRLDPQHDRVILSPAEMRALRELEQSLVVTPSEEHGRAAAEAAWTPTFRARALARVLGVGRYGPWLAPVGMVLMLATLGSSLLLSMTGALLVALGFAACLRRPWLRAPVSYARGRRRRRGG